MYFVPESFYIFLAINLDSHVFILLWFYFPLESMIEYFYLLNHDICQRSVLIMLLVFMFNRINGTYICQRFV